MPLPKKHGTFVGYYAGNIQKVVTDDGGVFYLSPGHDYAPGAKVGDRIELEYRESASGGWWYGKKVDAE